jgi:acetyl-CoA carboxylase biotin carboxyl carrier protein
MTESDEPVTLRPQDIAEILRVFAESDLQELHLEVGETRLHVSKHAGVVTPFQPDRHAGPAPAAGGAAPAVATGDGSVPSPVRDVDTAPEDGLVDLTSPLLGLFYRRPAPDQPPFIELGSAVEADDDVCVIDVMKMFTRVRAGTDGTIVAVLVEDGQLVEHGQVLMRIRPR